MENKVLARVGEKEITQNEVNEMLKTVGHERILHYSSPEGQKMILEELVSQELILQNAKKNKLDESHVFLAEVEKIKNSVLKQMALKELLSKVTVTDEDVKEYYDSNPESFKQQESWKASHILVASEEEATDIYKEIQSGKSFGDAALEYSKCPSRDNMGDLGFFSTGQMVEEFEDALKRLNVNEISECVATRFGFHLIQLTEKKEAMTTPFEEIKDELKKQLLLIFRERTYIETAENIKKEIPVNYL